MNRTRMEKWIRQVVFPLSLLLYPLRHVNQGVDLTDTGYSLYNYEVLEHVEATWWTVATYLANLVGSLVQKLPLGDTLLGMNLYTGLLVSVMALTSYVYLKKFIPDWIVWTGEMIAISLCWCPTVILYNYSTYVLLLFGMLCLYQGMRSNLSRYYIVSGVLLGLNVMVRFPNLTHSIFILSLWYFGYLKGDSIKNIARQTGLCLAGYAVGVSLGLAPILVNYGVGGYLDMVSSLSTVNESADSYSIYQMMTRTILVYWENCIWILYMFIGILLGRIYFTICHGRLEKIGRILYVLGIFVLFRWFYGQGLYNVRYQTYDAVVHLGTIFLVITLGLLLLGMFGKKGKPVEKAGLSMVFILILILPLGSNNYIYSVLNNFFLIAPIGLYACYVWLKQKKWKFPEQSMLVCFLVGFCAQCALFGMEFTFSGNTVYEKRTTQVTQIPKLRGMYTDQVRAEEMEEVYEFLQNEGYLDKELLTVGNLPSLHYYFDMPAYLSTSWIDLESYSVKAFSQDMEGEKEVVKGNRPIIITSVQIASCVEAGRLDGLNPLSSTWTKYEAIIEMMKEDGYGLQLINGNFAVYY